MRTSLLAFGNYLHQGEILFQILSLKLLKMTFFYLPIMDGSLRYFQVPKHLETPRNMKTLSLIWCWVVLLKRGLKQGDSSSTYIFILFILCMKGLSSLLKKAEGIGHIHGIKVCRGAHVLTHLLLADDIFFSGLLIMKLRSFNIS